MPTEVWQRGPLEGFDAYVMPVAHALMQVKEDLETLASRVPDDRVWEQPGQAASIGFHIQHIAGATDRLLTYARGEELTADQIATAKAEKHGPASVRALVNEAQASLDRALEQVRNTPRDSLLIVRTVGRAKLPSTTLGLLFHAAEHATRHMGQAITTAKLFGRS